MMHGSFALPEPDHTDPRLTPTPSDVVALIAQHLEVAGLRPRLTAQTRPRAETAAHALLEALVEAPEHRPRQPAILRIKADRADL